MRNKKSVFLLLIIFVLVAASLYLVYIIQDGSNPLAILNSRASEDDQFNADLLAQNGTSETPTPTIAFNSTSPSPRVSPLVTVSPSGTISPTPSSTPTATPTPSPGPTFTPTPAQNVSPTIVTELPVAGAGDYFHPYLIGAGLLIMVAMIL